MDRISEIDESLGALTLDSKDLQAMLYEFGSMNQKYYYFMKVGILDPIARRVADSAEFS